MAFLEQGNTRTRLNKDHNATLSSSDEDDTTLEPLIAHTKALLSKDGNTMPKSETRTSFKDNAIKNLALSMLVAQNALIAISTRYSRLPIPGRTPFVTSTAVVCTEILKVVVATIALCAFEKRPFHHMYKELCVNWFTTLKVGIPALLYTIQNNLLYIALTELDATVYQVMYQFKLVTTAIFSMALLGKSFSRTRWLALVILAAGVAIVQVSGLTKKKGVDNGLHISIRGLIAVFCAACLSGLAGVWFEKMLKEAKASLWMRNIQLGSFGIVFALMGVVSGDYDQVSQHGFFQGYSALVVAVIAQNAFGGLLVAIVIKYADNVLKGFATSVAILVTSFVCIFVPVFHFRPSASFGIGSAVVLFATYLYNMDFKCFPCSRQISKFHSQQV